MRDNRGEIVKEYVKRKIMKLHDDNNEARARANLSVMRKGLGKSPGDVPDIWMLFFDGFPEEFMSSNGEATKEEWAAYQALALFSLSQQGKDIKKQFMHEEGISVGTAIRRIARTDDEFDAVRRRFNMVLTSEDIIELSHHLRGVVQLLRSKEITMDYGQLAKDLVFYQLEKSRATVRLRWGQDFYRSFTKGTDVIETTQATKGGKE